MTTPTETKPEAVNHFKSLADPASPEEQREALSDHDNNLYGYHDTSESEARIRAVSSPTAATFHLARAELTELCNTLPELEGCLGIAKRLNDHEKVASFSKSLRRSLEAYHKAKADVDAARAALTESDLEDIRRQSDAERAEALLHYNADHNTTP